MLGASNKPERYAFRALNKLLDHGYQVLAVSNKPGSVRGVNFIRHDEVNQPIHTVTLYLGPENQRAYYDFLIQLKPERIIFNPGTENPELIALAQNAGISCICNCTLVMLDTGQF